MKKLTLALVVALLLGLGVATFRSQTKGYDVGTCSPTGNFFGAHIEIGYDLKYTKVAAGPTEIKDTSVVYKFTGKDSDGEHYVRGRVEIVISKKTRSVIIGKIFIDGQPEAVIYGLAGDGSKLQKRANQYFGVCQDLVNGEQNDPSTS